jgi:hypothetical protein
VETFVQRFERVPQHGFPVSWIAAGTSCRHGIGPEFDRETLGLFEVALLKSVP